MKLPLLAAISACVYPIPAVAGMVRFKRLSNAMKVFLLFCVLACAEIGGELLLGRKRMNNTYLSNYSFLMEPVFVFTVYFLSMESKRTKQIISTLAFFFVSLDGRQNIF